MDNTAAMNNSGTSKSLFSNDIFDKKRLYFDSGKTQSYKFRIHQLKKLKKSIKDNEDQILDALFKDFKKPRFEAFTSEVGFLYEEINFSIKNLKKWMRPKKVSTPIVLEFSKSKIIHEPLGVSLIIGPWNYPFQLLLSPLIGSIAGGNCSVLKPSNETPSVAHIIEKIIHENFESNYISVVQGPGRTVGTELIQRFSWNHVFFTGSQQVGKQVAIMAAEHLCKVTLELGGKSPAIVDKNANIDKAAKRIVFGKFFNAGQTCVCPDYVLVNKNVKTELVNRIKHWIDVFYGSDTLNSESLAHIVNDKRLQVLQNYLKQGNILKGGKYDAEQRVIEPTIMDDVSMDSPLMSEEIFGPILPIQTWNDENELLQMVRKNRYPLACYIFSDDKTFQKQMCRKIEFGGGGINNTLVHLVNPSLPFGGVGSSGMGNYHGKYSFMAFTHEKSILKSSTTIDMPIRYPPYHGNKISQAKLFFK